MPLLSRQDFDLVITLGDIDIDTLDYISIMVRDIPLYGVLGNHDPEDIPGVINLHRRIIELNGLRIGGFGGAPKYQDKPYHFTEKEAARRMKSMGAADLFITHCPPLATSAFEGPLHRGFQAFDDYLSKRRPRFWLHGHLHKRCRTVVAGTTVIGVTEKQPLLLEFPR